MFETLQDRVREVCRRLDIVANLTAENIALRQQLIVLKRNQGRPKLKERDRRFWVFLSGMPFLFKNVADGGGADTSTQLLDHTAASRRCRFRERSE